ncbi:dehydrogenase [Rhizobium leguminosarum]
MNATATKPVHHNDAPDAHLLEVTNMLAQRTTIEATEAVDEALAWHDGDSRATIRTLLEDCAHLQAQLAVASACMSKGFARGRRPQAERQEG